jgi:hypothetical protein
MNTYSVSFTKLCLVYETRIVDAYTIQDAKDMIWADDCSGDFSDQYVIEDLSLQEIKDVKHLCMLELVRE